MKRFKCEVTEEVFETRFASEIPEHVSVSAHELMRVLVAAHSIQDVGVLGTIVRWHNLPDRYGLKVDQKWHVTFAWIEDLGAHEIALERR